jgi:hypothetical protein
MTHDKRRGSEMALRTGVALSTLSLDELWTNYRAAGGNLTQRDLSAALVGALRLSPMITTTWPRCSTTTSPSTTRDWAIAWPTLTNSDQTGRRVRVRRTAMSDKVGT